MPDLICDQNNPQLDPTTYTMDEYVIGVLKAEVGGDATTPSWHIEALKAMAVAIRSFTWTQGTVQPDDTLEMGSTPSAQTFFPEKPANQNYPNAATQTSGQYLFHSAGEGAAGVITGNYSRQHGPNAGTYFTRDGGKPYLKSIYDPILGDISGLKGHGWGLAQLGAYYWAIGQDDQGNSFPTLNYRQILVHYYTGVHIKNANNSNVSLTPTRRWVPLTVNWGGNSFPPQMNPGVGSSVTVQLQNTGTQFFSSNTRLSCQWRKPDNSVVNCQGSDIANPDTLNLGASNTVNLNVTPYSDFTPGVYTLMIDLKIGTQYFHDWEAPDRPWFTLTYAVTVGDGSGGGNGGDIFLPVIFKGAGGGGGASPPGTPNCASSVELPLTNRDFSGGFIGWTVQIYKSETGESDLLSYSHKDPTNSYPAALLGGIDKDYLSPVDTYISQQFNVPDANPGQEVWLDVEYSYCIATAETLSYDFDEFWVEVRTFDLAGVVDNGVHYSNQNRTDFDYNDCNPNNTRPTHTGWRQRGAPADPGGDYETKNLAGDGKLWVNATEYKGDPLAIILRDDVDSTLPTTFYFDNIKIRACIAN